MLSGRETIGAGGVAFVMATCGVAGVRAAGTGLAHLQSDEEGRDTLSPATIQPLLRAVATKTDYVIGAAGNDDYRHCIPTMSSVTSACRPDYDIA